MPMTSVYFVFAARDCGRSEVFWTSCRPPCIAAEGAVWAPRLLCADLMGNRRIALKVVAFGDR